MTNRLVFLFLGISSLSLTLFGLYLQHSIGLEPCAMCILQRFAFIGVCAFAFVAFFHNCKTIGVILYHCILMLISLAGLGIASRHVYLEHYPPPIFDCGADLEYMLNAFPLTKIFPMIFRGTGDCSEVLWTLIGLSIAEWALIWFLIFSVISLIANVNNIKQIWSARNPK